jgi:hypothetical protein
MMMLLATARGLADFKAVFRLNAPDGILFAAPAE